MSDEDAFLACIRAHPRDDTPKLVYADWLDDYDQPEKAAFLRLWVEYGRMCSLCYLGKLHTRPDIDIDAMYEELQRLATQVPEAWGRVVTGRPEAGYWVMPSPPMRYGKDRPWGQVFNEDWKPGFVAFWKFLKG